MQVICRLFGMHACYMRFCFVVENVYSATLFSRLLLLHFLWETLRNFSHCFICFIVELSSFTIETNRSSMTKRIFKLLLRKTESNIKEVELSKRLLACLFAFPSHLMILSLRILMGSSRVYDFVWFRPRSRSNNNSRRQSVFVIIRNRNFMLDQPTVHLEDFKTK